MRDCDDPHEGETRIRGAIGPARGADPVLPDPRQAGGSAEIRQQRTAGIARGAYKRLAVLLARTAIPGKDWPAVQELNWSGQKCFGRGHVTRER